MEASYNYHPTIKDLSDLEKKEVLDVLMSRIIEDILTFSMIEAMACGNNSKAEKLIEEFFKKYDLRILTLGNLQKQLASLAISARRVL